MARVIGTGFVLLGAFAPVLKRNYQQPGDPRSNAWFWIVTGAITILVGAYLLASSFGRGPSPPERADTVTADPLLRPLTRAILGFWIGGMAVAIGMLATAGLVTDAPTMAASPVSVLAAVAGIVAGVIIMGRTLLEAIRGA